MGCGMRIATASVRTGFAMTVFFTRGAGGGPMLASAPTEALQEVRWEESPSHGFAVPAPFRQGGQGDGRADVPVAVPKISALPYGGHLKF